MLYLLALACSPPPAERIFAGGAIYTQDPDRPLVDSVAITAGRIVALGNRVEVLRHLGPLTDVVDLEGGALFPGFIDTHNHLAWSGAERLGLDLAEATSLEETLDQISGWATAHPDAPWIVGGGWDPAVIGAADRLALDTIVPQQAVFLTSYDGHSAWVNSLALNLAGVSAASPVPRGGRIELGSDGAPSGVLREDAATLFDPFLPDFDNRTADRGLYDALRLAGSYGITTVMDPAVERWTLAAYRRAERRRRLTVRVRALVEMDPDQGPEQVDDIQRLAAEYDSEMIQVVGGKLYLDGVIESGTAALLDPELGGPGGELLFEDARLAELLSALNQADLVSHAHSIGDGAVRQYLDQLEVALTPADRRIRPPIAAHLQLIHPDDAPRFAGLGVYASFSPLWAWPDEAIIDLADPRLGEARADRHYPIGSVADAGGSVVVGSDWSVTSMNPWPAIEVGVRRADPDSDGGLELSAAEAVDLDTLLAGYTRVAAEALGLAGEVGVIAVGAQADLVLLEEDPYNLEPEELSEVQVHATWLGGRLVWQSRPVRRP